MTITQHYLNTKHRLILLDYDGTLVDIAATAGEAQPTHQALDLLNHLASDAANTVVIISGRDHTTLDTWLGHLPLAFVAEHGLFWRRPGQDWQSTHSLDQSWKNLVRPLLEGAAADVPGASIENKTLSLVWHYRAADQAIAAPAATRLAAGLRSLADAHGLKVMSGRKIIEVLPAGINKGDAAQRWLQSGHYDFIRWTGL
jgi:trehalose 6-phosphate synthase/phosphatase